MIDLPVLTFKQGDSIERKILVGIQALFQNAGLPKPKSLDVVDIQDLHKIWPLPKPALATLSGLKYSAVDMILSPVNRDDLFLDLPRIFSVTPTELYGDVLTEAYEEALQRTSLAQPSVEDETPREEEIAPQDTDEEEPALKGLDPQSIEEQIAAIEKRLQDRATLIGEELKTHIDKTITEKFDALAARAPTSLADISNASIMAMVARIAGPLAQDIQEKLAHQFATLAQDAIAQIVDGARVLKAPQPVARPAQKTPSGTEDSKGSTAAPTAESTQLDGDAAAGQPPLNKIPAPAVVAEAKGRVSNLRGYDIFKEMPELLERLEATAISDTNPNKILTRNALISALAETGIPHTAAEFQVRTFLSGKIIKKTGEKGFTLAAENIARIAGLTCEEAYKRQIERAEAALALAEADKREGARQATLVKAKAKTPRTLGAKARNAGTAEDTSKLTDTAIFKQNEELRTLAAQAGVNSRTKVLELLEGAGLIPKTAKNYTSLLLSENKLRKMGLVEFNKSYFMNAFIKALKAKVSPKTDAKQTAQPTFAPAHAPSLGGRAGKVEFKPAGMVATALPMDSSLPLGQRIERFMANIEPFSEGATVPKEAAIAGLVDDLRKIRNRSKNNSMEREWSHTSQLAALLTQNYEFIGPDLISTFWCLVGGCIKRNGKAVPEVTRAALAHTIMQVAGIGEKGEEIKALGLGRTPEFRALMRNQFISEEGRALKLPAPLKAKLASPLPKDPVRSGADAAPAAGFKGAATASLSKSSALAQRGNAVSDQASRASMMQVCRLVASRHSAQRLGEKAAVERALLSNEPDSVKEALRMNENDLTSIREMCAAAPEGERQKIVGREEVLTLLNLPFPVSRNTRVQNVVNRYAIATLRTATSMFQANPTMFAGGWKEIAFKHVRAMQDAINYKAFLSQLTQEWEKLSASVQESGAGATLRAAGEEISQPPPTESLEAENIDDILDLPASYESFNDVNLDLLERPGKARSIRRLMDVCKAASYASIEDMRIQTAIIVAINKRRGKGLRNNSNPFAEDLIDLGILKGKSGSYRFRGEFVSRYPGVLAWYNGERKTTLDERPLSFEENPNP